MNDREKSFMDADEFLAWVEEYDSMELEYRKVDLPAKIDKIFVSSQQRALKSAVYLEHESETSDLLVEVYGQAFMSGKIKLPKKLWLFLDILHFFVNVQRTLINFDTIKRARDGWCIS